MRVLYVPVFVIPLAVSPYHDLFRVFSFDNPASPGHKIFVLTDPSHLLKKLRNSAENDNRNLVKSGEAIV
jgi:hypothetical protein